MHTVCVSFHISMTYQLGFCNIPIFSNTKVATKNCVQNKKLSENIFREGIAGVVM